LQSRGEQALNGCFFNTLANYYWYFDFCGVNGVYFNSNSVFGQDFTLKSDLPYILQSNLGEQVTVEEGTTLTLEPGVVIKAALSGGGIPQQYDTLLVRGTLIAQGGETASTKIVFTSFKDDQYGGDTNNDGDASAPAPGDWKRIVFASSSADSVLNNVLFRYGGPEDEIITIEGETEEESEEEEILDQETIGIGENYVSVRNKGPFTYLGQSFTAGEEIDNLKIFRAYLSKQSLKSGNVFLNIFLTDENGLPTSSSLDQASLSLSQISVSDYSWIDFYFDIALIPDTKYIAVLTVEADNPDDVVGVYWRESTDNYLRGTAYWYNGLQTFSLLFQTWYLPPADTESSKVDMINIEKEYCL